MNDTTIYDADLLQREDEYAEDYILRIGRLKGIHQELPNWFSVANLLNDQLDEDYDESTYRKRIRKAEAFIQRQVEARFDANNPEAEAALRRKGQDLEKIKVRARDATREYRAELRHDSRLDELKEHIWDAALQVKPEPIIDRLVKVQGNGEGILCISDWHIGAYTKNYLNEYNLEIARGRVRDLAEQVIAHCELLGIRRLNVLNLGDMIEGNIHVTTRVQNELDVVDSTIKAGELLVMFLVMLDVALEEVIYRKVLDNHSRITANYKEHIEAESFAKFIDWWLEPRLLVLKSKVQMVENVVDDNIGSFRLENGKLCYFVHGHMDKPGTVFKDLIGITREIPDYIFMAHYHTSMTIEQNLGTVYVNGSLKGVDDYGMKKRYVRKASQKLLMFEEHSKIDIDIIL